VDLKDRLRALEELLLSVEGWSGGRECMGCDKPTDDMGWCRTKACVVHKARVAIENGGNPRPRAVGPGSHTEAVC
jgi:hypothetical protein